jgi:2-keto-3-deoxy-6-phosphogluconate aldolase
VVWNLRDSANRAVAPGSYTVEILAESESGERVRKFFPVNIVR